MAVRPFRPLAVLDRSAGADIFRHTLSRIPTLFGRLMYLGSLRDPLSGVYRHHGLLATFGREQGLEALKLSHSKVFREWLRLPLSQQKADLEAYLESLDDPKGLVVEYWLESQGYLSSVPETASKADRSLYTRDLERLLRSFSAAAGGGSRARESSRRR